MKNRRTTRAAVDLILLAAIAQAHGYVEILEPNALDSPINSMRKSVTFTKFIAQNP